MRQSRQENSFATKPAQARYHCRGAHINHAEGMRISFGGLRPQLEQFESESRTRQPVYWTPRSQSL